MVLRSLGYRVSGVTENCFALRLHQKVCLYVNENVIKLVFRAKFGKYICKLVRKLVIVLIVCLYFIYIELRCHKDLKI